MVPYKLRIPVVCLTHLISSISAFLPSQSSSVQFNNKIVNLFRKGSLSQYHNVHSNILFKSRNIGSKVWFSSSSSSSSDNGDNAWEKWEFGDEESIFENKDISILHEDKEIDQSELSSSINRIKNLKVDNILKEEKNEKELLNNNNINDKGYNHIINQCDIPYQTSNNEINYIKAYEILKPFLSKERLNKLNECIETRSGKVKFIFEDPINLSNVWACLRTLDSFGIQFVDIILNPKNYMRGMCHGHI